MTELRRRTPAASMNYLAGQLEAALNGDPKQLRNLTKTYVIALRATADVHANEDLTEMGFTLRAALDKENIPADVASRIWNRFFFGQPEGLVGR